MSQALTFINPATIERIETGSFVPARRSQTVAPNSDRRDLLSPLSVTKRCIRYEPNIFFHRQALLLRAAHSLNQPEKKILLVGGGQGSGKTSLIRGLVELMGSQSEQILWFDVNRHSDFEEIIQFLIQYITSVCSAEAEKKGEAFALADTPHRFRASDMMGSAANPASNPVSNPKDEPLHRLEQLITKASHMPLLLVLDNVEYLVDQELRFNSFPFKEMLNFLLAFPNIKMVLIGERLPYADMSPNQEGVEDLHLEGLSETDAISFLSARKKADRSLAANAALPDQATLELAAAPEKEQAALLQLYLKTDGQPWLLKILTHLNHQANLDFPTLNRLLDSEDAEAKAPPVLALVRYIYQRLPDQHRRLFQVMAFLRHPVGSRTLLSLVGVCYPVLGPSGLTQESLEDMLEHSLLKGLLKISYPPQQVLAHIRQRQEKKLAKDGKETKFKPWYELYHNVKRMVYQGISVEERDRIHTVLQDFYLREKAQDSPNRVLRIKNRAILAEAKHHGSAARERKAGSTTLASGAILPDSAALSAQTYMARQKSIGRTPEHLTLSDYKNVRLPDNQEATAAENQFAAFMSESAETNLDGPTFIEILEKSSGQLSFQEQLAEIELSEDEKALLFEPKTEGQASSAPAITGGKAAKNVSKPPLPQPVEPTSSPASPNQDIQTLLESHEDEQEREIQQRLVAAVASQNRQQLLRELIALARYRAANGRYESANACLQKALSLKADANKEMLAEIYSLSGSVNKETYHHNAALATLSKAAVVIRQLMYEDDTVDGSWMGRLGKVYQDLGDIYAYRKQCTEAADAFNQALRWYHSADDESRQAEVHFQLAGVYDDLEKPDEAIVHYQKALQLDEPANNDLSCASSLANLGQLHWELEHWDEAIECFQRSLQYDRQASNREGQLNTLEVLTSLYLQQEIWAKAEAEARQGLTLAMQEQSSLWQSVFYMKLGQLYELQQNWPLAIQQFQLAHSSGSSELSSQSLAWIQQKINEARHQLQ